MKAPTPKQVQVLQLMADGFTTDEIAVQLENSPRTIDSIRNDLLLRLQSKNAANLVAIGFRNGWIS